jgi:DNA gyrase/topoisomerase IV subunit B
MVELEDSKSWVVGSDATTVSEEFDEFSFETSFLFTASPIFEPFFRSYVNYHYTSDGGSHVRGVTLGIERALKKFVRAKDPELRFVITHRTILRNLVGAVHVRLKSPKFAGSVSNRLLNDEIIGAISDSVFAALNGKFESNPSEAVEIRKGFSRWLWT